MEGREKLSEKQMNKTDVIVEEKNSAKFSISQKGKWSGEVKVYDINDVKAYNRALALADVMADKIKEKNREGADYDEN